jgi:hypothetical protein
MAISDKLNPQIKVLVTGLTAWSDKYIMMSTPPQKTDIIK